MYNGVKAMIDAEKKLMEEAKAAEPKPAEEKKEEEKPVEGGSV